MLWETLESGGGSSLHHLCQLGGLQRHQRSGAGLGCGLPPLPREGGPPPARRNAGARKRSKGGRRAAGGGAQSRGNPPAGRPERPAGGEEEAYGSKQGKRVCRFLTCVWGREGGRERAKKSYGCVCQACSVHGKRGLGEGVEARRPRGAAAAAQRAPPAAAAWRSRPRRGSSRHTV